MTYLTAHGLFTLNLIPKRSLIAIKKVHPAVIQEILNQCPSFHRPSIKPCFFIYGSFSDNFGILYRNQWLEQDESIFRFLLLIHIFCLVANKSSHWSVSVKIITFALIKFLVFCKNYQLFVFAKSRLSSKASNYSLILSYRSPDEILKLLTTNTLSPSTSTKHHDKLHSRSCPSRFQKAVYIISKTILYIFKLYGNMAKAGCAMDMEGRRSNLSGGVILGFSRRK